MTHRSAVSSHWRQASVLSAALAQRALFPAAPSPNSVELLRLCTWVLPQVEASPDLSFSSAARIVSPAVADGAIVRVVVEVLVSAQTNGSHMRLTPNHRSPRFIVAPLMVGASNPRPYHSLDNLIAKTTVKFMTGGTIRYPKNFQFITCGVGSDCTNFIFKVRTPTRTCRITGGSKIGSNW